MFRNLNCRQLGITGRQSELMELTLTYRFQGLDLNMEDFQKRVTLRGLDYASRYLRSAGLRYGLFDLPGIWAGDDNEYRESLGKLPAIAQIAKDVEATRCRVQLPAASNEKPFNECVEMFRQRITSVAETLSQYGLQLGLDISAAPAAREGKAFEFVYTPERLVQFVKLVNKDNVGVILDTWAWRLGGGFAPLEELPAAQVVGVRLSDVPPDADPAAITEEQRILPQMEDGSTDFLPLLRKLADGGYEGPVTPFPALAQFAGETRESIIRAASVSILEIWRTLELFTEEELAEEARGFGIEGDQDEGDDDGPSGGGDGDDSGDDSDDGKGPGAAKEKKSKGAKREELETVPA